MKNKDGLGILAQIEQYPESNYKQLHTFSEKELLPIIGKELTDWVIKERALQLERLKARRIDGKPEYRLRKSIAKILKNET